MPIRVAIVEDDHEIREGLAFLINASPGFQCLATWSSAEEALRQASTTKPEVVLMDIGLPGASGIDCVRQLKAKLPNTQIMMLTVFEEHDKIFKSLTAGASGYLLKDTPPAKLLEAIQDLHRGGSPMSNQIARCVVEVFRRLPQPAAPGAEMADLSPREQEVLNHLTQGLLYKEIADRLGISIDTVRTHIRNVYEKLHVRSRTEAILKILPGTGRTTS